MIKNMMRKNDAEKKIKVVFFSALYFELLFNAV
jgi:hypothetical protein